MENKSHAFATGLFTILLGAAIIVTLLWLRRDTTERVPYDVVTHGAVTGLAANAPVRYRGLLVGRVQRIGFDPSGNGDIDIRIMVDAKTPITHATEASLGLQGVTGLAFVQLSERSDDALSGGTTGTAASGTSGTSNAAGVAVSAATTDATAAATPLDHSPMSTSADHVARIPMRAGLIEQLEHRGQALLTQMAKISDNLGRWTNDGTRMQFMETMASIRHAANHVDALALHADPVVQKLPQTMAHLDQTVQSANRLMTTLNRPDGPLIGNLNRIGTAAQRTGDALADISAKVRYDTLPRLDALSDNVRVASRSISRAADLVADHPRSLLFGTPAPRPGPGEAGFGWPSASRGHADAPPHHTDDSNGSAADPGIDPGSHDADAQDALRAIAPKGEGE
ncbi:MlaD family protein [Robbsia sp. KACC 23696]|uniref:MlaD family protein n=1 Tax=Robbsia sp. KACC 23696 TaxID=3149231 RepID=UPI00325B7990